jgi:hypothetical protein
MHCSLFKFTLVLNYVLAFWKLGCRVPTRYLRDSSLFSDSSSIKNYPARCVSTANILRMEFDVFLKKICHSYFIILALFNLLDIVTTQ